MYEQSSFPELLNRFSPELLATIGQYYDIQIYGIVHGKPLEEVAGTPEENQAATPIDHLITRSLVDDCTSQDRVYIEGAAYTSQTTLPPLIKNQGERPEDNQVAAAWDQNQAQIEATRSFLHNKIDVQSHTMSAIDTAAAHAQVDGHTVRIADASKEELDAVGAAYGYDVDAADSEIHKFRNVRALMTILSDAVRNLPPEGTPPPNPADRPKWLLLFGSGHIEGFNELVERFNLPVTVVDRRDMQLRAGTAIMQLGLLLANYCTADVQQ